MFRRPKHWSDEFMAKKNTKKRREEAPSYGRLVAWTTVIALVFSAGLITGQRLIEKKGGAPLVSVSSSGVDPSKEDTPTPALSFSFYDKLSPGAHAKPAAKPAAPSQGDAAEALPARYTLQVGAYPSLQRAKSQIKKLKTKGLEPHMDAVESADRGKLYRVRVGKFHSMEEARHFQAEVKRSREVRTFVTPL